MVIVLDQNFQVSWVWNSFSWLNTNRLGTDYPTPSDWLHANAVSWSPEDDDLIVSLRTQDWVIKIDYADGTGNGHVIWKLGPGGNFKAIANTPQPVVHPPARRAATSTTTPCWSSMTGTPASKTTKRRTAAGRNGFSTRQNMTATLVVNADMGNYSSFLGSAELLSNGDLAFTSGGLGPASNPFGQSIEVLPNGTRVYVQQMSEYEYRSYFESTLYSADLLD